MVKKKGFMICGYCERTYFPDDSTAEDKKEFCSQACETLVETKEENFEEGGVEND